MLSKIITFELRYRFTKSMTYLFMAMMVFQAIWYAKGTYDFYINDATNLNAAGTIYQSLAGGGMLMIIVIAIITGTALFKDIEFKTGETLFSYPVKDRTWLLGKFTAAYLINLSVCLAYALGFSILQYSGIAAPEKFGPVPWGHIFYGFLIFSVPNMFIITTISLSLVVFFRNMASSYLGVFILMMLFILAEGTRENSANINLVYLIDPMNFTYTKNTIQELPVEMKNYAYFQLTGTYWANRGIWLGIASIMTFFAFRKFSFKYFLEKPAKKSNQLVDNGEVPNLESLSLVTNKVFSTAANIKMLFRLSLLELRNTIRPVGFKIIFGLLAIMFFGYNYMWNAEYYIHTDTLPLTSMMTFTRLPNGVYIFILLAVFAGELLFKEKSTNVWQITEALPVPTWVTWFSKYLAMAGISFLFALLLFIPGVVAQLLQGFTDIEWGVYFNDIFSFHFGWINYLMVITLAFFMGAVTANRFTGHIITVFILFFIIVFADIGIIEQWRFTFPFTPGIEDYSEMNGYGVFGDAARPYLLLWLALSIVFIFAGLWFWNRGCQQPFSKRFSLQKQQLNIVGKIVIILFLGVFFYMQHYVQAKDLQLGNFKTDAQEDAEDAGYEKRFKYIENQNHPLVCGLDLTINIEPESRKACYDFEMQLTNTDNVAIDTLHLNLKDFVVLHTVSIDGKELTAAWNNSDYNQSAYLLPKSLQVGDTITFKGSCTFQYIGFCSDNPQRALVYNGSFLEEDIVPHIGYNDDRELDQNRTRGEYGLTKLQSRMDPVNNLKSLKYDALSPNALRHKTTIKVHSSAGQTAYVSGAYKGTQTIDGKEYAVYENELPFAMKWFIGSANYLAHQALLKNKTTLNVLYDARHAYNLSTMEKAANDGIAFLEKHIGKYPYSQLTIAEIPFYNEDNFYTAPNIIAISEKHCWTADGKREKDLSYIYYTICREMVAQWVQQNMQVADVQGADMLLKALPEAYALWYVKEKFGNEVLQIYLDKKQERYGKGRGIEANVEQPLIFADGADYLEVNKGAMELLKVIETMGIENFSEIFKSYLNTQVGAKMVFKDLYRKIEFYYPNNMKETLKQDFLTVKP